MATSDIPDDPLQGDPLDVFVRGERFTGWKDIQVLRTLDSATGAFSLGLGPDLVRGPPMVPGDQVRIEFDGEALLEGFCDKFQADTESASDLAEGKDRTADLVEAAVSEAKVFFGPTATIAVVAGYVAGQFSIPTSLQTAKAFQSFFQFSLVNGESAWTSIDRAARMVGVILYTDGSGRVVAADPGAAGKAAVDLIQGTGGNVESAQRVIDNSERFDPIIVRGQRPGDDDDFGDSIATIEGSARDPGVGRLRPLIIVAESAVTIEDATRRAQWEAIRRAARADRVTVMVGSWRQGPGGKLWKPNMTVRAVIPRLRLDQELLINRVTFRRSMTQGTGATLELVRPDAFDLQPEVEELNPFFFEDDE